MFFKDQIEDLAGDIPETFDGDNAFADGIRDASSRITGMDESTFPLFTAAKDVTAEGLSVENNKLTSVFSTADKRCMWVEEAFMHNTLESDSLYYGTSNGPVYYISNGKLFIAIDGSLTTGNANVFIQAWESDDSAGNIETDSTIDSFPSSHYHLPVFYAAAQVLHHKLIETTIDDVPDLMAFPQVPALSAYTGTIDLPTAPVDLAITSNPPVFTSPTFNPLSGIDLSTLNLNISNVPPTAPSIITTSITLPGNIPSYISPSLSLPEAPVFADIDLPGIPVFDYTISPDYGMTASLAFSSISTDLPAPPVLDFSDIIQTISTVVMPDDVSIPAPPICDYSINPNYEMSATLNFSNVSIDAPGLPILDFSDLIQTISTVIMPEDVLIPTAPVLINVDPRFDMTAELAFTSIQTELPVGPVLDFSDLVQAISEVVMPSDVQLPAPPTCDYTISGDFDFTSITTTFSKIGLRIPAPPVLDFSDLLQIITSVNMPSDVVLPTAPIIDYTINQILDAIDIPDDVSLPGSPIFDFSDVVQLLTDVADTLPNDITLPELPVLDFSVIQIIDAITLPEDVSIPVITFDDAPIITDLTFSVTAPSHPILPAYEAKKLADLHKVTPPPTYQGLMTAPDFAAIQKQLDEEDPELGALAVQKVSAELNDYNIKVQDALNKFNKENNEYQVSLQLLMQEVQQENAQAAQGIQKYQSEVGAFQAVMSQEIEEWKANYGDIRISTWSTAQTVRLQKYQTEVGAIIQKYQADISKLSAIPQTQVAAYSAQVNKSSSENQSKLNAYQAEVGGITSVYQAQMSGAQTQAQAETAVLASQVQLASAKNNVRVTVYQAEVAALINKYQADIQKQSQIPQTQVAAFSAQAQRIATESSAKVNSYQAELGAIMQKYQANISKVSNKSQAEVAALGGQIQASSLKNTQAVAIYQAAKETGISQSEVARYSADLQRASGENQVSVQKYQAEVGSLINKYQADIAKVSGKSQAEVAALSGQIQASTLKNTQSVAIYQAQLGGLIQEAQLELSKDTNLSQSEVARYGADLQRLSSQCQSQIQVYQAQVSAILQKHEADISKVSNKSQAEVAALNGQIQASTLKNTQSVAIFQAQVSGVVQEAQIEISKETGISQSEVARYAQDLQRISAENQSKAQTYQSESQNVLSKWQSEEITKKQQEWIQSCQNSLQTYTVEIQNSLNSFNRDNVEYQAELNKATQDVNNLQEVDRQKVQLFSSELTKYQADVQIEVGEWTTRRANMLQEYQVNIQKLNADLGITTQDFTASLQVYQQEIQKDLAVYGGDTTSYQAEVQAIISKFTSELSETTASNQESLGKYSSEVQAYSADTQGKIQRYQQEMQKTVTEYQWLQQQLAYVKGLYAESFAASTNLKDVADKQ